MKPKLTSEQIKARKYKFGGLLIIVAACIGFFEWYIDSPKDTGQVGQPFAQVHEDQLQNEVNADNAQLKIDESTIATQQAKLKADEAIIQELKTNAK